MAAAATGILISLVGCAIIASLAHLLGLTRSAVLSDETDVRRILAAEAPRFRPDEIHFGRDRRSALVRSSDQGVALLIAFGAKWLLRGPFRQPVDARIMPDQKISVRLGDITLPKLMLAPGESELENWLQMLHNPLPRTGNSRA